MGGVVVGWGWDGWLGCLGVGSDGWNGVWVGKGCGSMTEMEVGCCRCGGW